MKGDLLWYKLQAFLESAGRNPLKKLLQLQETEPVLYGSGEKKYFFQNT